LRGGNLLQVTRPEQSLAPIREAQIYYHVLFSAVATHDLADQTSALLYPVVVCHPHSHTHAYILRLHDQVHAVAAGLEAVFSRVDKNG
jgi:hypothetical protein